ncbi:MAG TPA: hypothetical protein VKL40_11915 [Candidatus Angelobacter sp.]|nr:hypothetical protein [Candidatus Angelobacter sp.]
MTIFGFNTVVKSADAEYHVQSEARQHDLLLQTLIFVKGQAVGKHTYSYAAKTLEPGFSEAAMHELLKAQHKAVIDALHEGRMDLAVGHGADIFDVGGSTLSLKWSAAATPSPGANMTVMFHVQQSGQPVKGAEIVVVPCPPAGTTVLARALTDSAGSATLTFPVTREVEQEAGVIVRATRGGESATRKLRLKK